MKTRILLPAAVVLVIVAMLFAPDLIESDPLKGHIERQIERETGLDARISGRANLALLPYPRIKAEGLSLHDGAGRRVARVAVLRGEIRALPLIGGRVDITAWTLSDAEIEVEVDRDGRSSWAGLVARMAPEAVLDVADAVHVEGVQSHLLRHRSCLARGIIGRLRHGNTGARRRWPSSRPV